MQTPMKRIRVGLSILVVTFCLATVVYMFQSDTLIDALYMAVITLFSVGDGEIGPVDTPSARLFTMLVIVVGCSSVLYVSGGFIQKVMEGEIDKKLGDRRRAKEIEQLTGHAIICGFGRIGQIIARELKVGKHPFVILEQDEDWVQAALLRDYLVIEGDTTNERYLSEARVEQATTLATVSQYSQYANNNVGFVESERNNPHLVIAIRHPDGSFTRHPEPSKMVKVDDTLVLIEHVPT